MADINTVIDEVQKFSDEEKTEFATELISRQSVLWLSQFVKTLEDKFGVSAAPVMAGPVAGGGGAAAGGEAEEAKSTFDVVLKSFGGNKIAVIKVVRAATSLGLKEAKDLVDKAPQLVKDNLTKEDADKLKTELEGAGAEVELK